jgi:uncharacterized protein YbaR (Trm112 family)
VTVDGKLLAILVCPLCKGKLQYKRDALELWCKADGLAYPIQDDIPIMLDSEARTLTTDEKLGD